MKICSKCKIEKEFTEFCKDKYKKDGLCYACKSCKKDSVLKCEEKIKVKVKDGFKICVICNEEKELDKFHFRNKKLGYRQPYCKNCNKKSTANYYKAIDGNKKCKNCNMTKSTDDFYKNSSKKDGFYNNCKECTITYEENCKNKNIEKARDRQKNKLNNRKKYFQTERYKQKKREYDKKNKKRINEYKNRYAKERRKIDVNFRLIINQRRRINHILKGVSKSAKTLELIGCGELELKIYLESLFTEGMTWDNYGKNGWHIDHIRPCASFDLSDTEQQRQCCHYTNLRPMWAKENYCKNSFYEGVLYRKTKKSPLDD